MPITKSKSWSDIIYWPYKRLAGLGHVKHNDPIVFNFPAGDTVVVEEQVTSYYEIVRKLPENFMARYNFRESVTQTGRILYSNGPERNMGPV